MFGWPDVQVGKAVRERQCFAWPWEAGVIFCWFIWNPSGRSPRASLLSVPLPQDFSILHLFSSFQTSPQSFGLPGCDFFHKDSVCSDHGGFSLPDPTQPSVQMHTERKTDLLQGLSNPGN